MPQQPAKPTTAIERGCLMFEAYGDAEYRAMREAEARGNIMDMPLRHLLTRWWTYTAITRIPELRNDVPFFRQRARQTVKAYRALMAQRNADTRTRIAA